MPPPLDIDDCSIVIAAWPTGHVDFRLARWLFDAHGIPWDRTRVSSMAPRISAYNDGVLQALDSGKTHLLFVDHDVIPVSAGAQHPGTDAFLDGSEYDVVCCPCRLDLPGAWASPDAFHCGMWRTTRDALLRVDAPYFMQEYSPDGRTLLKCICSHFATKARAAGLTVGRAGWADHVIKRKGSLA